MLWWSEVDTPIGRVALGSSERGLARVLLPNQLGERAAGFEDDGRNAEPARPRAE